ncbi:MAG: exodeoxyribonuclease V subunit alpha [Balneolaceae bacterium]|nr:MAG: exodeoxyribonuclease V subunit alpha [Balneolaceae bacterium]
MNKDKMKNNEPHHTWWQRGILPEAGWIGMEEQELIRFLEKERGEISGEGRLALVFVSLFLKGGHTALPLDRSPQEWGEIIGLDPEVRATLPDELISPDSLLEQKLAGRMDEMAMMTLDGNSLSIRKYYNLETKLLQWFTENSENKYRSDISKYIGHLFPETDEKEVDWQKVAVVMSAVRRVLILSGGPGTGKTTAVARMLMLNQLLSGRPLRMALTAPTGKAAGRMGEALRAEFDRMAPLMKQLGLNPDSFPREAKTLHRLLSGSGREGLLPPARKRLLPFDLIVVDEASMMDLELVSRLIAHMGQDTRLILMGDKDQLSSVEAGSVFADLCRKRENGFSPQLNTLLKQSGIREPLPVHGETPLEDSIVYLTRSYRFDESSGIGRLAAAVRSGSADQDQLTALFEEQRDLELKPFSYVQDELEGLTRIFRNRIAKASTIPEPAALFAHWKEQVWLNPLKSGFRGTERLNRLVEESAMAQLRLRREGGWYHGRPVIITQNDYHAGVYNGDLGVCMEQEGEFRIWVESSTQFRCLRPDRIRALEPFYFLTVHKSQGSEFDEVNLLLPEEDHPLLTRELIYTAVTRARKRLVLHGSPALLATGIQRNTERYTGLKFRV